jgi:hypothetical protein
VPATVADWNPECTQAEMLGPSKAERLSTLIVMATGLLVAAVFYFWRLGFLKTTGFDRDEFEHLHAAWLMSRGLIPYRDFFEHHTPGFWIVLAPLYRWYPVEQNPDTAVAFIFMARRVSMVFAGVCLVLTMILARMWRGDRVAWIAVALLSTCVAFMHKTLEIRPDVPATALWLGYLAATYAAFGATVSRKQASLFGLSGLLLGGAVMCTQKLLVVLPAIALAMVWYLAAGEGLYRRRLANCCWQAAGFGIPILAIVIFFASRGALGAFVHYNLATNLNWKGVSGLQRWLWRKVLHENSALVSLAIVGVLFEAWRELHDWAFTRNKFLLLATLGAIAGLVELPEAWLQYCLIFLPLLAIYAAGLLDSAADRALQLTSAHSNSALSQGLIGSALALALIAVSVGPGLEMRRQFEPDGNARQLNQLRWVMLHTRPTDTVMDCWSGLGVFRPNALYYSMLYGQMLNTNDRERLASDLMSGRLAPKLIFPSHDLLRWVSPHVRTALLSHYMAVPGEGFIFFRVGSDNQMQTLLGLSDPSPASPADAGAPK